MISLFDCSLFLSLKYDSVFWNILNTSITPFEFFMIKDFWFDYKSNKFLPINTVYHCLLLYGSVYSYSHIDNETLRFCYDRDKFPCQRLSGLVQIMVQPQMPIQTITRHVTEIKKTHYNTDGDIGNWLRRARIEKRFSGCLVRELWSILGCLQQPRRSLRSVRTFGPDSLVISSISLSDQNHFHLSNFVYRD